MYHRSAGRVPLNWGAGTPFPRDCGSLFQIDGPPIFGGTGNHFAWDGWLLYEGRISRYRVSYTHFSEALLPDSGCRMTFPQGQVPPFPKHGCPYPRCAFPSYRGTGMPLLREGYITHFARDG